MYVRKLILQDDERTHWLSLSRIGISFFHLEEFSIQRSLPILQKCTSRNALRHVVQCPMQAFKTWMQDEA